MYLSDSLHKFITITLPVHVMTKRIRKYIAGDCYTFTKHEWSCGGIVDGVAVAVEIGDIIDITIFGAGTWEMS